jgi:acyl-coenzyme A thioesterase PaaI-like protein
MAQSVGEQIRANWEKLSPLPGGKWLFSTMIGRMAPYTGTIGATVMELRPGYAKVELRDRKNVRNHLESIHAIALMNLGEVATGLAMMSQMPADARSILVGLSMDYTKKARGTLVAECTAPALESSAKQEYAVEGVIRDAGGEAVATARARWLVGPRKDG